MRKEVHHKKILNLEKGITLDPVWAEFNETFREIMSKGDVSGSRVLFLSFPFVGLVRVCICMQVFQLSDGT